MFEHRLRARVELKQKFAKRERVFGGWVSYREPAIAETFAKSEFDFLAIDMEHTTISIDEANRIITSVQSENCVCIPRQVSHSNDFMKPLLEAGADGIMLPMVDRVEDAEKGLQNCKFPPVGRRSFGVNRAHGYGFDFDRYIQTWNESSLYIAQVESIEGVENIDDIVNVVGLDAVMLGPYDISGSLNVPGQTNHPSVRKAGQKVIDACERAGISCITQLADVTRDNVRDAFDQGFTTIILASDLFVLWKWSENMGAIMKEARG